MSFRFHDAGLGASLSAPPAGLPPLPPLPIPATKQEAIQMLKAAGRRWSTEEFRGAVRTARDSYKEQFAIELPVGVEFTDAETEQWAIGYIEKNGLPRSASEVVDMGGAFVSDNAAKLGVPPSAIAAIDLVKNPPDDLESAARWTGDMATDYAKQFGIPMAQKALTDIGAEVALSNIGVPPEAVDLAVDLGKAVLGDGALGMDDVRNAFVAAVTYACAAGCQALGIPAPIGAFIGGIYANGIADFANAVFGPSDSETRREMQRKLASAAQKRSDQCLEAASEAWEAYIEWWKAADAQIRKMLEQPQVRTAVNASGGVRFFHGESGLIGPRLTAGQEIALRVNRVLSAFGAARLARPVPCWDEFRIRGDYSFIRSCSVPTGPQGASEPNPDGCLYWDQPPVRQGTALSRDFKVRAYWSRNEPPSQNTRTLYVNPGGLVNGTPFPRALLAQWHALQRLSVGDPSRPDQEMLRQLALVGTSATRIDYDCAPMVAGFIQGLQADMEKAQCALSVVAQDIMLTVAWVAAKEAALLAADQTLTPMRRAKYKECVSQTRSSLRERWWCMAAAQAWRPPPTLASVHDQYIADMTEAEKSVYWGCVRSTSAGGDVRRHLAECRVAAVGEERGLVGLVGQAREIAAALVEQKRSRRRWGTALVVAAGLAAGWLVLRRR